MSSKFRSCLLALPLLLAAASASAAPEPDSVTRLVVQFRNSPGAPAEAALRVGRVAKANPSSSRPTAMGGAVIILEKPVSTAESRELALRMRQADPNIRSVEPDVRVRVRQATSAALPADTYASQQWSNRDPSFLIGGARLFDAWSLAGATRIPVAVLDTGSLPHADLTANEIAGYDFIVDDTTAADGEPGRDSNPSDPGDYCAAIGSPSTWHGTKVASQIAAIANNNSGIAGGAANNATVQHVRVLGQCGGWLSDVADAVIWAAGGTVAGVPANATPARVINLSLSSTPGAACPGYMQTAINEAVSRNAVVVAAAGNEGVGDVGTPGNCDNVITVAAHTASGDLANYSNHSSRVTLSAPGGGGCITTVGHACSPFATVALGNAGAITPGAPVDNAAFNGTSAAAPHASAAAALLLTNMPSLTPAQVRAVLAQGARPHPAGTYCAANAGQCGAGMLDAYSAIERASTVQLTFDGSRYVRPASNAALRVTASGGVAPYAYIWTQLSGAAVALSATASQANFTAPVSRNGDLVFRATVTDAMGHSSYTDLTVTVNSLPVLTLSSQIQLSAGAALSLPLTATDADGDAVDYVLVGAPEGMEVAGDRVLWASANPGQFQAVIRLSDGHEEVESAITFIVSSGGGSGGGASSMLWLIGLAAAVAAAFFLNRRSTQQAHG